MIRISGVNGNVIIVDKTEWNKLLEELNNSSVSCIIMTDGIYEYLISNKYTFAFARIIK
ncbi:MAG: hypothetical protein QW474_02280 [Candidatus Aenigmatarchaeota archaeon]